MGRRHGNRRSGGPPADTFEMERTLAAAEEDLADGAGDSATGPQVASDQSCSCGSNEFLLEAYLHVVDGRPKAELVEVETLSCPQCGREYEAIQVEDGRVLRGEFLGQVDLEEE